MDLSSLVQELKTKIPEEFNPLYADLLYKGNLINADKTEAIKLMQTLSENGDKNMSYQLGYIYYSDETIKSIEDSISYFNRAHRQGHPDAKRTILKIQQ
jgi:TPR repeat protein